MFLNYISWGCMQNVVKRSEKKLNKSLNPVMCNKLPLYFVLQIAHINLIIKSFPLKCDIKKKKMKKRNLINILDMNRKRPLSENFMNLCIFYR